MPKQFRAANIRTVRGLFSPPGERQFFVYDAGYAIAAGRLKGCLAAISEFLGQGERFMVFCELR
jgi:hypothetical protein